MNTVSTQYYLVFGKRYLVSLKFRVIHRLQVVQILITKNTKAEVAPVDISIHKPQQQQI